MKKPLHPQKYALPFTYDCETGKDAGAAAGH